MTHTHRREADRLVDIAATTSTDPRVRRAACRRVRRDNRRDARQQQATTR